MKRAGLADKVPGDGIAHSMAAPSAPSAGVGNCGRPTAFRARSDRFDHEAESIGAAKGRQLHSGATTGQASQADPKGLSRLATCVAIRIRNTAPDDHSV